MSRDILKMILKLDTDEKIQVFTSDHEKMRSWFFKKIISPEFLSLTDEDYAGFSLPVTWLCAQYLERARNEKKQPLGKNAL